MKARLVSFSALETVGARKRQRLDMPTLSFRAFTADTLSLDGDLWPPEVPVFAVGRFQEAHVAVSGAVRPTHGQIDLGALLRTAAGRFFSYPCKNRRVLKGRLWFLDFGLISS